MSFTDGTSCPHEARERVVNDAGAHVATRCRACTEILRLVGSCPCGRDGYPARSGFCSDECAKEAEKKRSKVTRQRRAAFRAATLSLPGVDMEPTAAPAASPVERARR